MPSPVEKLTVWQLAHQLVHRIYKVTAGFPVSETYGLTSQLRRAAVSVPTNIVEGNARGNPRENARFCQIAKASGDEVRYLLRLCVELKLLSSAEYSSIYNDYDHLGALLYRMIRRLR